MMSRIGPKDTKPEIMVRKGLHRLGFRYRLYTKDLPGNALQSPAGAFRLSGNAQRAKYRKRF